MKRFFLIDGSALVHRSFHAFSRAGLTSGGIDVGMLYGFLVSILSICRREKPDLMAVAFDTGAPTFRHQMFDDYKANRPPLNEDIRAQLPLLYEMIDLLRIPQLAKDGWEADDLIGTLAVEGETAGLEVFMVTGDKDFYQLVTDKVKVYTLPTKSSSEPTIYDPESIKTKFGVHPSKVTDVLALMGDSSDNVPGVPKVGAKTAVSLINQYGSLDEVLRNAPDMKPSKVSENLVTYAEQARFSKKLVIIDTTSPVDVKPQDLYYGPLNNVDARSWLTRLQFFSILSQLDELEPPKIAQPVKKHDYQCVTDAESLEAMIDELRKADLVSMDVETTSLDPMKADLVGMSFSVREKHGWYVAVNHFSGAPDYFKSPSPPVLRPGTTFELAYILEQLKPIYGDPELKKTGQNLKYDILVLKCYGCEVEGVVLDTMIASHLLDSSSRQHNLDYLAEIHIGFKKIPTRDLIGSGSKQISMADVKLERVVEYACEDSDIALRLTNLFMPRIKTEGFESLMGDVELPLMKVLVEMEQCGVALDLDMLSEMSTVFQAQMDKLVDEVHQIAGMPFNLNSTQQLADVLYNRLGLPPGRKTKFGYSTDIGELERLAPVHELPAKLLRYRHLSKLLSTYIDSLPRMVHPITGRVHTSYSQTIAATGRLSSNDPNLQNIPIRTGEGGQIRRAFIAGEPDWLIMSADYSQIELRIMAHLSGDERLLQAFNEGLDIHSATAGWMYDMPQGLVTPDIRRQAKEVNFGVLYGMGDFGLAQRLGITRKRAKEFIDQYFRNFARVKEYIDEIHESVRKDGFVKTMLGRKRLIPEINSRNFQVRSNAERIAINTPIQGSAADLIKLAMIQVQRMLKAEDFRARMLLQVHDELVFETPPDELERLIKRVREVMAGAMTLKVAIEVDAGWGKNWLEAHQ